MRLPLSDNPAIAAARAVLLGILILVAGAIRADAFSPEPPSRVTDVLESRLFEAERGTFLFEAEYHSGGGMILRSPLGEFDGQWSSNADTLCIAFRQGPAMGQSCATLVSADRGVVTLSNGVVLHEVASVFPSN